MKKKFYVSLDVVEPNGKLIENYEFAIWAESDEFAEVEAKLRAHEQIKVDYDTDCEYDLTNVNIEEDLDDMLLFRYSEYSGEREPELRYSTMTVGELIRKLTEYPMDMNINLVCQTRRTAYQNFTDTELVLMSDIDREV